MRLFVSVDLDGFAEQITAVQDSFEGASGLRFTDPEQAHITLKFLGDTDAAEVQTLREELAAAVEESDVEPFETTFGGLGVFPDLSYISVVWLGVREGESQLTRLHEAVEKRTTALGFDPEDHAFTPHVTLARMDHAGGKELVQEVVENEDPTVGSMTVEELRLTESELTDDGPVYSTVESFAL